MSAKLYLDTNVFIGTFEGSDALSRALTDLLALDTRDGQHGFATSELTLAELLVHPYRYQDDIGRQRYDSMIRPSHWLAVGPVDRQVLTGAAVLRSRYRLKLPDAVHLSTALHFGCDSFLTGDGGLTGTYSLDHVTTGQRWSDRAVQILALDLATIAATAERLRA